MADEIKKIKITADTSEAKKELESLKASAKAFVEQTKSAGKLQLENTKASNKLELEDYKATQREKLNVAKQTQAELSKFQGQSTGIGTLGARQEELKYWKEYRTHLTATSPELVKVNGHINTLTGSIKGMTGSTKMSTNQLMEFGENLTVIVAGLSVVIPRIFNFGKESLLLAAKTEQLRSNFKGTEDDLNRLKAAFANTVDEGKVLELSNQASLLGISLDQQAKFAGIARLAAQKMGMDAGDAFETLLKSTEFVGRAIISLGLSKTKYNEITKDLVKTMGGETEMIDQGNGKRELTIKNLTAEQQQKVRIEALNKLVADSYGNISDAEVTNYEKTQQLTVIYTELKEGIGKGLLKAFTDTQDVIGKTNESEIELAERTEQAKNAFAGLAEYMLVGALPLAFKSMLDLSQSLGQSFKFFLGLKDPFGAVTDSIRGVNSILQRTLDMFGVKTLRDVPMLKGILGTSTGEAGKGTISKEETTKTGKTRAETAKEELDDLQKLEAEQIKVNELITYYLDKQWNVLDLLEKQWKIEKEIYDLKNGKGISGLPKAKGGENITEDTQGLIDRFHKTRNAEPLSNEELVKQSEEMARNINDAFSQALGVTSQISGLLGQGASEIVNAFQTAYGLASSIVNLINTIVGALSSATSGGGGGGGGFNPMSLLPLLAFLGEGGETQAHTPYIIGERGAELFVPDTAGTVIPHNLIPMFNYLNSQPSSKSFVNGGYMPNYGSAGNVKVSKLKVSRDDLTYLVSVGDEINTKASL